MNTFIAKMFSTEKVPTPEVKVLHKEEKRPFMLSFPIQEQVLFAKRLGMILHSGMPILDGLNMFVGEAHGASSLYIYKTLASHVASGQPLSSGLKKFPKIFNDFSRSVIEVGEATGTLPENLGYLSDELKKNHALKKKVKGALVYPIVIVVATLGITVMLTVFIFPKIVPIFQSFKTTLPFSTRVLMSLSHFLTHHGLLLIMSVIGFIVGFVSLLKIYKFQRWFDRALLSIPVFGKLTQAYNVVNISRTLGLLLKSEIRVVVAFETLEKSTKNLIYKEHLAHAMEEVKRGQNISLQFKGNPILFPPIVSQMIAVGESTGNMSSSFIYISEMYDEEISDLTKNLANMIEPVLMVVMGIIVGFIAVSIISPIYGITQSLNPYR